LPSKKIGTSLSLPNFFKGMGMQRGRVGTDLPPPNSVRWHLDASWTGIGTCLLPPNFLREHGHAKKVDMCLSLSNCAFKKE
jgi:hypothetical protein